MTFRRCLMTAIAAAMTALIMNHSQAEAYGRRTMIPPAYNVYPWGYVYPQFNPYMAPIPGYGIMPLPLATYGARPDNAGNMDALPYEPRSRSKLYPAVPYEPTPTGAAIDRTRARFEITVPTADAIVLFDGAKTKQTGVQRTFHTPSLTEGKQYSMTIEVQWRDEAGTSVTRRRTFEFTPGQTITHQFAE